MQNEIWQDAILSDSATIGDVIKNLNKTALKITLISNVLGEFIGTVSDGDIRRGLLRGLNLDSPIKDVTQQSAFVVTQEVGLEVVKHLMLINKFYQIPIVNSEKKLVGLHLWDNFFLDEPLENKMVVMAGGKGTRLMPHTENCPKPMVLVGGKPMLQYIIERAKTEGFQKFVIAIHHLGEVIENHFGVGESLGVEIDYLKERSPLGTAGALSLLDPMPKESIVVTNGDVMSDIHYREILMFHKKHNAIATMAVRAHEWQHPFGVVKMEGLQISGFEEKPIHHSYINAGVYVLSPAALEFLQPNTRCDMPELFEALRNAGKPIFAYPMHEPWMDVGRPYDLEEANKLRES